MVARSFDDGCKNRTNPSPGTYCWLLQPVDTIYPPNLTGGFFVSKQSKFEIHRRLTQEVIEQKIYLIRAQSVMLDRDLAALYGVETRALNQAVKRNQERFPQGFMFVLTRKEILGISQFVTSLKFSKQVQVFTEQGVAMLSSVLNSDRAVQVNIAIMQTFVKLRKSAGVHKRLARKLDQLEGKVEKHDKEIENIFDAIRRLIASPEPIKRRIGFHPQKE